MLYTLTYDAPDFSEQTFFEDQDFYKEIDLEDYEMLDIEDSEEEGE